MTDTDLGDRAATVPSAGDDAITALYDAHWVPLVRLAWLLLPDQRLAESVAADALVAVGTARRHRATDASPDPRPDLIRCVVHGVRAQLRRLAVEGGERRRADERAGPVADAVRRLPRGEREALVLRCHARLPDAQVAAALGTSTGAVAARARRGLAALGADAGRVGEALDREALRVTPRDRLAQVCDQGARVASGAAPPATVPSVRLLPVAAVVAVLAIAAGVWGATRPAEEPSPTAAPTTTVTTAPAGPTTVVSATRVSTTAATPTPSTAPSSASLAAAPTGPTATATPVALRTLTVYYLDPEQPTGRLALYRDRVASTVAQTADAATAVRAALTLALSHAGCGTPDPCSYWAGMRVDRAAVANDRVTVVLAGSELPELGNDAARLAVQQLVWTAQDAVGDQARPVRFARRDGGSQPLFSLLPLDRDYVRPPPGAQYSERALLWIDSPTDGAVLPAGARVVARGSTCAAERLSYDLTYDDQPLTGQPPLPPVRRGTLTSGTVCGGWTADLGRLSVGTYSFSVYAGTPRVGWEPMLRGNVAFSVR